MNAGAAWRWEMGDGRWELQSPGPAAMTKSKGYLALRVGRGPAAGGNRDRGDVAGGEALTT